MKNRGNYPSYLSIKNLVLLALAISVGVHLIFSLASFFGNSLFFSEPKPMPTGRFNFLRVLMFTGASFVFLFLIFLFNRKMILTSFKKKYLRVMVIIVGSLVIAAVFSLSFSLIMEHFNPNPPKPGMASRMIRDGLIKDFLLTAIVILVMQMLQAIWERNQIAVENESLRAENINTHYQALKSQLDPHFMFNSLNTLQSLIDTDTVKAHDYVQELSQVLRAALQNKEVVTLQQELQGVQAYCNLMQIRYGENLHFDFQIDPKFNDYQILPLSVQGLVENAIKHNVISGKQPLMVSITTTEEGLLKVFNPIQPKIMEEPGNGIGLANLTERYRLKWDKNVEIVNDGHVFMVTLPLVEPQA